MYREQRTFKNCRISIKRGKNEKITVEYCVGMRCTVCVGASFADHHDDDHNRCNGTITEFSPGSTIVLKESNGPVHYRFGKTVTYVTRSGKVLDEEMVRTRIKVGVPVRVHYAGTGDSMLVDRVILDED